MFAIFVIILIAAIVCTLASAIGKLPLWIAVALLCLIELLRLSVIVGH